MRRTLPQRTSVSATISASEQQNLVCAVLTTPSCSRYLPEVESAASVPNPVAFQLTWYLSGTILFRAKITQNINIHIQPKQDVLDSFTFPTHNNGLFGWWRNCIRSFSARISSIGLISLGLLRLDLGLLLFQLPVAPNFLEPLLPSWQNILQLSGWYII